MWHDVFPISKFRELNFSEFFLKEWKLNYYVPTKSMRFTVIKSDSRTPAASVGDRNKSIQVESMKRKINVVPYSMVCRHAINLQ